MLNLLQPKIREVGEGAKYSDLREVVKGNATIFADEAVQLFHRSDVSDGPEMPDNNTLNQVTDPTKHIFGRALSQVFANRQELCPQIELSTTFFSYTIPKLLLWLSQTRKFELGKSEPQHEQALVNALSTLLAQAAGDGTIDLFSPVCPPYDYTVREDVTTINKEAPITHTPDGGILPTVGGQRISLLLDSTRYIFADLLAKNVNVNMTLVTYTGEGLDPTNEVQHYGGANTTIDLFEMGQDVLDHYQGGNDGGEKHMKRNLKTAADEARAICTEKSQAYSQVPFLGHGTFHAEFTSIETTVVPHALVKYESFLRRFFPELIETVTMNREQSLAAVSAFEVAGTEEGRGKFKALIDILFSDHDSHGLQDFVAYEDLNDWCKQEIGLNIHFLIAFLEEEYQYRLKQSRERGEELKIDGDTLLSAIREGLLYWGVFNQIRTFGGVLWGAETTTNYTNRLIEIFKINGHDAVPSLMLKPLNREDPTDIFGVRGPFNPIVYTMNQATQLRPVKRYVSKNSPISGDLGKFGGLASDIDRMALVEEAVVKLITERAIRLTLSANEYSTLVSKEKFKDILPNLRQEGLIFVRPQVIEI